MRRNAGAIVTSTPGLTGAVTILVVIVAVLLAYSANNGLPFVPTYKIKADLPFASNLVHDDDVRIGGFRVGQVTKITPTTVRVAGGGTRPVAQIEMSLDKSIAPLPVDSTLIVRPISTIGLKYVQLTPGHSKRTFAPGSTIPLAAATRPVELDTVLNTFDQQTREASQSGLATGGDLLAGRGDSLNEAIQDFVPFLTYLTPVMRVLNSPENQLARFFQQAARTSATIREVAEVNAVLFSKMADTYAAISNDPLALQQTIEKNPPTEAVGTESLAAQRPFLADFADLSGRLMPGAAELTRSLPAITDALSFGRPVLPQTVDLNDRTKPFYQALDNLARKPVTLPSLEDLRTLVSIARPLVNFLAPYQTVCNYAVYTFDALGYQQDEQAPDGTIQRVQSKSDNGEQTNRLSTSQTFRPPDVPSDEDPRHTQSAHGLGPLEADHGQPYAPAITANGDANCQNGQNGYPSGPIGHGRLAPHRADPNFDNYYSGGSHVAVGPGDPNYIAGPTFTGVPSLKDVP